MVEQTRCTATFATVRYFALLLLEHLSAPTLLDVWRQTSRCVSRSTRPAIRPTRTNASYQRSTSLPWQTLIPVAICSRSLLIVFIPRQSGEMTWSLVQLNCTLPWRVAPCRQVYHRPILCSICNPLRTGPTPTLPDQTMRLTP